MTLEVEGVVDGEMQENEALGGTPRIDQLDTHRLIVAHVARDHDQPADKRGGGDRAVTFGAWVGYKPGRVPVLPALAGPNSVDPWRDCFSAGE